MSDKPTTKHNSLFHLFHHTTDGDDDDDDDDDDDETEEEALRLFPSLMAFQIGPRTTGKERERVSWRSGMRRTIDK